MPPFSCERLFLRCSSAAICALSQAYFSCSFPGKRFRRFWYMSEQSFSSIRLGIVCPMASEESSARSFIDDVLAACAPFGFKSVTMFAVLDRASKDHTREILDEHARTEPRLQVVWSPENKNVVDAYVRGYREALAADSDWTLEIDAGYSHQPSDIPQFFTM